MTSLDDPAAGVPDEPVRSVDAPTAPEPAPQRRGAEPDAVCSAAVELARAAAQELAGPGEVGDHLGILAEGDRLVTHYFASWAKGYRGWRWAITVARAPRSRAATVCEALLLPGDDAILAPAWVPWSDRLAPGDLGAADVLPYREDDPLLDPGYEATDDEAADRVALWELGLGRPRVLNRRGRGEVADRWYHGDRGPTADEAVHAAAACSTCGYFLPLAGALRQVFGVCANEWSPSDAKVVSVDHGCGAHSETDVERPEPLPLPEPILDETGAEAVVLPARDAVKVDDTVVDEADTAVEPGDVSTAAGDIVVEPGEVTVESGDVAAESRDVAAESGDVAAESGDVAAEPGDVAAEPGDSASDAELGAAPVVAQDGSAGPGGDAVADDGTGAWEADQAAAAEAGAPAWTDPGLADPPGADPGDGPVDEGQPLPGEGQREGVPLVIGDGVTAIGLTPLQIGPEFDVGPAVHAIPEPAATPEPAEATVPAEATEPAGATGPAEGPADTPGESRGEPER